MIIEFEDAGAEFEKRVAVAPLTLTLRERRIGIIGLNGSGKTTFARMVNGLVKPSSGMVTVDGLDTAADAEAVRAKVGFIFQNPQNQIILPILKEDIALGLRNRRMSEEERQAAVDRVLTRLAIAHLAGRRTHELSGGELQLAALASVLVTEPDLVILDEPTNQLDLRNRAVVRKTIEGLEENAIVISHDLDLIAEFDRVLVFHESRLAFDGALRDAVAHYRDIASA